MVYGRQVGGKELNFEASGALLKASLVMRDRETDSWWSIMTSDAIGGDLEGADLEEIGGSVKAMWGDWKRQHPNTTILSVNGKEHEENNPYDNYFASDDTFRGLIVDDQRLAAKANIFAFHLNPKGVGRTVAFAIEHDAMSNGVLFRHPMFDGRVLLASRVEGQSFYASSDMFWVDSKQAPPVGANKKMQKAAVRSLLELARAGKLEAVSGFDTFWYSWVAVNQDSQLLQ